MRWDVNIYVRDHPFRVWPSLIRQDLTRYGSNMLDVYILLFISDKNECDPNPCRNSGRCIDQVAGYFCECAYGWKGRNCMLSML